MTVYANIKRPVFKGFNTIWSLLTEENRPPLKRAIPLDKSFVPSGLVVTDENENNFHNFVDPNFKPMIKDFVFDYFNSFNESAILDGYNYIIDSGYRSFEYLQAIWDYNVSKMGLEKTRDRVAPTGCSEHQSGLTIE